LLPQNLRKAVFIRSSSPVTSSSRPVVASACLTGSIQVCPGRREEGRCR
jgi:hypothetical protein